MHSWLSESIDLTMYLFFKLGYLGYGVDIVISKPTSLSIAKKQLTRNTDSALASCLLKEREICTKTFMSMKAVVCVCVCVYVKNNISNILG